MDVYLKKTECCAIQEIGGLNSHISAEDAMLAFCSQSLTKPMRFGGTIGQKDTLYSFYLFTAGVSQYYGNDYGSKFCSFIQEHGLGEVWASPQLVNAAFHKERKNQVWVWMPNLTAVKEWWLKKKHIELQPLVDPEEDEEDCEDDSYDEDEDYPEDGMEEDYNGELR
jgi:hypothetical protein